jgi:CBS domain-containing protein
MITARHIMSTTFHALHPQTSISAAARQLKEASQRDNRRVFGMMVIDDNGKLVGILSMYDILLFFQPKHTHIWGEMSDIDLTGLFDTICSKSKDILVGDIMTRDIITIPGETHIFAVLEIMNRKHIRRIPVIEDDQVVGIVYISDLFFHLVDKMI